MRDVVVAAVGHDARHQGQRVREAVDGHMGDRAGPFQAEHAGSNSSDRECHTVEEFAGIRSVVVPLSESMEGDAQAEDADENLFHFMSVCCRC